MKLISLLSKPFLAGALLASLAFGAHAGSNHGDHNASASKSTIKIEQAWTRATVKTAKVGAGYLIVKNTGTEDDRLIAGAAPFSERIEIHEMTLVDDVMRMRPLADGLLIPAGGEVALKPGAEHVMFMGLSSQLTEGETVKATLTFEKAGDIEVSFKVNALAAREAGHGDHSHGDHNHGDHSH